MVLIGKKIGCKVCWEGKWVDLERVWRGTVDRIKMYCRLFLKNRYKYKIDKVEKACGGVDRFEECYGRK